MPSLTLNIPKDSDLHRRLITKLDSRIKFAQLGNDKRHEKWARAEELTMAYVPESDVDAMRRQGREEDGEPAYTTIQLPYTFAMLMSAHTYISSVFFGRTPVHQYSGNHGEGEQQTQACEALINYQVVTGEMLGPYYIWIYDVLKYGYGVIGEYWEKHVVNVGSIAETMDPETGKVQKLEVIKEFTGYEGNKLYNVSPYDFWPDPRVPANRFQDGEFCVALRRLNWSQILRRERQGFFMNVDKIDKSKSVPTHRGSSQLERPEERDWIGEADGEQHEVKHPAELAFFEVYVDLVPSEWGLGKSDYPMKWVFSVTYDKELIVGATPLGYYHAQFPFMLGEAEIEGYGLFSRGMPEIMEPIQNTMDWLINSHFYNVRAALNNQFIMDPSRIVVEDAEDGGPGFRYRLRPEAFGQKIDDFFKQVAVQDVTRAHMDDIKSMQAIGEKVFGVNDQIMGAFSGTTRRTAAESRITAGFGTSRLKTNSEYLSGTAFAPHSRRLIQNSQQYFSGEKKFRIAGDLALEAGRNFMEITPELIAGAFEFVPVDGNLPIDRLAQANLWKEILINVRNMPWVLEQYDVGRIFAWAAQLGGLKNINQFKINVLPPGMAPGQGAIPVSGAAPTGVEPGNAASTQAGLESLNQ